MLRLHASPVECSKSHFVVFFKNFRLFLWLTLEKWLNSLLFCQALVRIKSYSIKTCWISRYSSSFLYLGLLSTQNSLYWHIFWSVTQTLKMAQIKTNILNETVVGDVVKGDPSSGIQYYPGNFFSPPCFVKSVFMKRSQWPCSFPDDDELNHWMLAMIGIGLVFITFVGVSIYLMW